ncbi:methyltransferase domain-containing protein [Mycetocola spongiae]|uniref:methyltransferase domain-containing protein n=1 Tax=Mycetocola spongiae TaxID=2859226 RepID=UPI001CF4F0B1|nr:class I SAM-dependent methyltransferase [Mycetocola spongiae]UCR88044.1 class I SAM-dependent methyltransferase [Mycetocola spongiae]
MTYARTIRAAYALRATEYTAALGSLAATSPADRDLIARWAGELSGPVLDAGCGPGQWTAYLRALGIRARGIDLVPEFISAARDNHPGTDYAVGSFEDPAALGNNLGGILAWYSLIHTDPAQISAVLAGFARALAPGGGLLLGFFEGAWGQPFDHRVHRAYTLAPERLGELLREHGFTVLGEESRQDPGARPHAAIRARLGAGEAPPPPPGLP